MRQNQPPPAPASVAVRSFSISTLAVIVAGPMIVIGAFLQVVMPAQ
jgi:hypothetical protein